MVIILRHSIETAGVKLVYENDDKISKNLKPARLQNQRPKLKTWMRCGSTLFKNSSHSRYKHPVKLPSILYKTNNKATCPSNKPNNQTI